MSGYDRRRVFRVYACGKSYVLASQLVEDEKLQLTLNDTDFCVNTISSDEWTSIKEKMSTNSVRSPSYGTLLEAFGCLGLLSISTQQMQPSQQQQSSPGNTSASSQNHHHHYQNQRSSRGAETASSGGGVVANMIHFLVFVKEALSVGTIRQCEIMKITDVVILPLNVDMSAANSSSSYSNNSNSGSGGGSGGSGAQGSTFSYINDIKKFLSSGVFYFALSSNPNVAPFDLTLSSQARHLSHATNKKFLWNFNLHLPFRRLNVDTNKWLLKIICGCVEIKKVITLSQSCKACLFSRLSCERVGTRFNCRGVNDDGHVANFVETEQVVFSSDSDEESSFLQVRGSVPVFFEQTGLQVGSHRIKITRSTHACYPAFERHMRSLVHDYGTCLYVLNLLGIKGDEFILTNFFQYLCQISSFTMKSQLTYRNYDYHSELKMNKQSLGERLWPHLIDELYKENHAAKSTKGMFFSYRGGRVDSLQERFIRTNCMDCLDRTNSVQSFVGIEMLRYQLAQVVGDELEMGRFRELYRQMWIINGDCISRIYAGTGAIQGKSMTQDLQRSLTRAIQNNFLDNTKQDAMDTFLYSMSRHYGELADRVRCLMSPTFLRLPYAVLRELVAAKAQYVEAQTCRVAIGTWNINGGLSSSDMEQLSLREWLVDGPNVARQSGLGFVDAALADELAACAADSIGRPSKRNRVDIFAIGFEEIVDLNAQNIMNASDENATVWFNKLVEFLKREGDYVQLNAENLQLVGVCLFVFVLKKHVGHIKDVSVGKTKTGFGGAAGNKGACLLRFVYYNTSMCFVCAHFAANQKEIRQRNEDFRQIYEQSEFAATAASGGKLDVRNHDYVFWFGDLNYRIDMANERCRALIGARDWQTLLELDQLNVQRRERNVFREFNEAPISFPPTYKYNVYEDTYDRSEKCRVPAWTDRVLWRRRLDGSLPEQTNVGRCLYYGRADIRYSDHRPVSALLEVEVNKVVPKKLIDLLHKTFQASYGGSFQLVLMITTHTGYMSDKIRAHIVKLCGQYRTMVAWREYRGVVYATYSDAKYGYEAYADLSNYTLVGTYGGGDDQDEDAVLQVRIENEHMYPKLIEQELMDCLASFDYASPSFKRLETEKSTDSQQDVQVAHLLGEEFSFDDTSSSTPLGNGNGGKDVTPPPIPPPPSMASINLNLPVPLHATNHSSSNLLAMEAAQPSNPLVKALSNSNLSMFNVTHDGASLGGGPGGVGGNPRHGGIHNHHSTLDLPAMNNNFAKISVTGSNQLSALPPPRRPPPPLPPSVNNNNSSSRIQAQQSQQQQQTTAPSSAASFKNIFGDQSEQYVETSASYSINNDVNEPPTDILLTFDDHFTSTATATTTAPIVPSRPPPLPPLPSSSSKSVINNPCNTPNTTTTTTTTATATTCTNNNPLFSLFDDDFQPLRPVQAAASNTQPPPLPPFPPQLATPLTPALLANASSLSSLSSTASNPPANSYIHELASVLTPLNVQSTTLVASAHVSQATPLPPQPPPLPPKPAQTLTFAEPMLPPPLPPMRRPAPPASNSSSNFSDLFDLAKK